VLKKWQESQCGGQSEVGSSKEVGLF